MPSDGDHETNPAGVDRRRLLLSFLVIPLILASLFLPAGTWAWPRGWLFVVVLLVTGSVSFIYIQRKNPELIAARINRHQGTKSWDKILLGVFLTMSLAIFPVAALDDGRFHWYPMPWWVCGLGYVLLLIDMGGLTWAQVENKFFEPTVRLQTDRDQKVIETGPYAIVRHPGYVSASILFIGLALGLGSLWALIPAGLCVLLLALRTQWEDQTLQAELPGYKEYAARVRYKWMPGIW
jgi:protein-S-isoprenylcysteine O-methyltransferase Ste14